MQKYSTIEVYKKYVNINSHDLAIGIMVFAQYHAALDETHLRLD